MTVQLTDVVAVLRSNPSLRTCYGYPSFWTSPNPHTYQIMYSFDKASDRPLMLNALKAWLF